jgi:hypothetical protein
MTYGATRVPRRAGVGLVVLGVIALGAPFVAKGAGLAQPDYSGGFEGYKSSRVQLQLRGGAHAPESVRFQATEVVLACETESSRATLGPITVRFDGRDSFEGASYSVAADGSASYLKLRGRLLPGGRAQGYIFYFEQHPETAPYEADCSTNGGRYRWHARRVR